MKANRIALTAILISIFTQVYGQTDSLQQDSLLMLIQNELNSSPAVGSMGSVRSLTISNPRISAIGDMQTWYNPQAKTPVGAALNEMEFSFQSAVDPYARADVYFTVEHNPLTGENSSGIEEAYLTTLSLPAQLQLRVGRLKPAFGKINTIHSHVNPFIDYPVSWSRYFGSGLAGDGFSLSWLVPQTLFYQEITAEAIDGAIESPVFSAPQQNGLLYSAHLKNFFELNENTSLEWGLSALTGPNDSSRMSSIYGSDLTLKWKPLQLNTYKSLTWQNEIYFGHLGWGEPTGTLHTYGLYSLLSWQFAKRWKVTGRYDYGQDLYDRSKTGWSAAMMFGWYATEFQKIELESSWVAQPGIQAGPGFKLRWIFVIGSHGAHQY